MSVAPFPERVTCVAERATCPTSVHPVRKSYCCETWKARREVCWSPYGSVHFYKADPAYGEGVANGLGLDISKVAVIHMAELVAK